MRNWRLQWSILSRSLYGWLFFFFLKEVTFCFIMSTNFCVWPEGLILLAHCLLFFHWALIYPEEWSMCTHIESIWTKTNSAWKRHNAGEGSSSHHYFFLCSFFEFDQATPGQKLCPLVSFFFLFFFCLIFRQLFVGKLMLLISNQVEREEDEHIYYGNFRAFSNYILNTSRVLASFEVQDFFDCAFKCIAKAACFFAICEFL